MLMNDPVMIDVTRLVSCESCERAELTLTQRGARTVVSTVSGYLLNTAGQRAGKKYSHKYIPEALSRAFSFERPGTTLGFHVYRTVVG